MVTLDNLKDAGFQEDFHSERCNKMSCTEKKSSYTLSLKPAMECWKFQVDENIIKGTQYNKCDYLFVVKETDDYAEIFVELKGSDWKHAFDQLEATLKHKLFNGNDFLFRWARVAIHSCPSLNNIGTEKDKRIAEFKENYHCDLAIKNSDILSKDYFKGIKDNRKPKKDRFDISGYLYSGDVSKINTAIGVLYRKLYASKNPDMDDALEKGVQILSLLQDKKNEATYSCLRYVELCLQKLKPFAVNDNFVQLSNSMLVSFQCLYDADSGIFTLPEEIADQENDVRTSLLSIYTSLKTSCLFNGDDNFWEKL